jgi:hypothetical protein
MNPSHDARALVVGAAGEHHPSFNAAVASLQAGQALEIAGTLPLTADVELPDGVTLVFGPRGRLTGAFTLTGCRTRLMADEHACIFSADVTLAGTWNTHFSPQWFGAVYDGVTDCTVAIQTCLNQKGEIRLRGNGTALISAPLWIYSDTWLHLDPGFTIRLADHSCCPLLRTRWADQRYFSETFPTFVTDPAFPRFLSADDKPADWKLGPPEVNITVTGGTWDANGANNPRQDYRWGSFDYCGFLMQMVNVEGFILRDVRLFDPCTYFFEAAKLTRFCIENIHMDMRELRANQDGIHLEGECYNGVIQNIHGRTWDDMVALNGGDSFYPKYPRGVTAPPKGQGTNILWIPFLQGGIRHIIIRDIHVAEGQTGYRAVRLLSTAKYIIDEITIDGIYGRYAVNAVLISAHYESIAPYGTLIIRNLACTVDGDPETLQWPRQGHIKLENERVAIDTLIIDGGRYIRTPRNGQFFQCPGSVKRLFVSNLDISVAPGTTFLGRGAFNCTGSDRALVHEAYFSNVSINREAEARYDIAIQGRWRRVKMVNCLIDADVVCDFAGYAEGRLQEVNNEFICREFIR